MVCIAALLVVQLWEGNFLFYLLSDEIRVVVGLHLEGAV